MQVEWYGQSAFRLTDGDRTVFIDPFGDMSGAAAHGIRVLKATRPEWWVAATRLI